MPQTNDDDESENGRPLLSHFFPCFEYHMASVSITPELCYKQAAWE